MRKLPKLVAMARHPATWPPLFRTKTAGAIEHIDMLRFIRADTIIDVGANKGQFAIAALAAGAKRIISFEPLDSEAEIFGRNFGRDQRVALHRLALAESSGEAVFHVADRPDSSSLLSIGTRQTQAFNVREADTVTVRMERLDGVVLRSMLEGEVLLKIDVQGAECRVIEGARGLLPFIRYVYAEGSFVELYSGQPLAGDLIRALDGAGFALRGIYNAIFSPAHGPTQADMLFENRALTEVSSL